MFLSVASVKGDYPGDLEIGHTNNGSRQLPRKQLLVGWSRLTLRFVVKDWYITDKLANSTDSDYMELVG